MIKNYGMFNHHSLNELVLLFSDLPSNKEIELSRVNVLYHDQNIVGYKIKRFSEYAKIKYSGIIFLPNKLLIDVINHFLINDQLEELAYKDNSGYIIQTLNNQKVVVAKKGTFLRDEVVTKDDHICTYYDLCINDDKKVFYLDEDIKEGKDFFSLEA